LAKKKRRDKGFSELNKKCIIVLKVTKMYKRSTSICLLMHVNKSLHCTLLNNDKTAQMRTNVCFIAPFSLSKLPRKYYFQAKMLCSKMIKSKKRVQVSVFFFFISLARLLQEAFTRTEVLSS